MFNIEPYLDRIQRICKDLGVKELTLFGSALTDEFHDASDIDFFVELDDGPKGLKRYLALNQELRDLLNRPVDLVMPNAVRNEVLLQRMKQKVRICYAA
uniref:Polymerase nucleotidyl transferase domain-containing protein n=1 Tax=Candidatus Kentrum sp. FM TaxID=2126340 RepID=A0A450TDX0_9GAMM|nr:MAG: hypothetical protein BECKFM1743C_GA0114222_103875 [Candidatus Kentron sp. FM]VFJ65996.1 MAG: hypothetical protein BECKFM1743A_GA0114220_103976 [Candidatus Kentron sp. FM]VFK15872.1 MAG: hypothetical protein BECKFM1743B_GA0114221_103916 [Candidatus Kentron sp. FM]